MSDWELFDLEPGSSSKEALKNRFRKMAFAHHPDLGGDAAEFIKYKAAYDRLLLVIDPSGVSNSDQVLQEFVKELLEQYSQSFPWRPVIKEFVLAESIKYSREYSRQHRYVKNYLTDLARRELSNMNRLRLEASNKTVLQ